MVADHDDAGTADGPLSVEDPGVDDGPSVLSEDHLLFLWRIAMKERQHSVSLALFEVGHLTQDDCRHLG